MRDPPRKSARQTADRDQGIAGATLQFDRTGQSDEVGEKQGDAGGGRAGCKHQITQGRGPGIRLCLSDCDGTRTSCLSVHVRNLTFSKTTIQQNGLPVKLNLGTTFANRHWDRMAHPL
jgi:hypothetical protein